MTVGTLEMGCNEVQMPVLLETFINFRYAL